MTLDLIRRLVDLAPEDVQPDPTGECIWCDGGWENFPGPRGGKRPNTYTGRHNDGCPYIEAKGMVAAYDAERSPGAQTRLDQR